MRKIRLLVVSFGMAMLILGAIICSKPTRSGCCKTCTTGKACGDSCIAKDLECHQPPGCACNG
jgi:hypothetical protein